MKEKRTFFKDLTLGVAYYDEYIDEDRLAEDITLMKEAGISLVRIGESTWSTLEPTPGNFNFYHIDRVMDAMHKEGIKIIVGTPTYAIPPWMVKLHPEIMVVTPQGPSQYGHRQKMDISNKDYLFYAERMIRELISHVCNHPGLVGYQVDNETKHYDTSGDNVQSKFQNHLRKKFKSLEKVNKAFGLNYWSNRVNDWNDFPSTVGSINTSLNTAFKEFQLGLVTDFLEWQCDIIREYKSEDQFITHNFDYEWRDYSYGIQTGSDHYEASQSFDMVGIDVYHPSQDELTGCEIAFCGDRARSLRNQQYLVMETQAQGHAGWLHYPGQLILQAMSHIASGAQMVAYWHWHSLHNGCETYWKGILSHDFLPGRTYHEVKAINQVFKRISTYMEGYQVVNDVALVVDMKSLAALNDMSRFGHQLDYNDEIRRYYDSLYELNIGCDIVDYQNLDLNSYSTIIVPGLYSCEDSFLDRLVDYSKAGGRVIYGVRSGFCNEFVKVRSELQPGRIAQACGVNYGQFTQAKRSLLNNLLDRYESDEELELEADSWIELLEPHSNTDVLYAYDHPYWSKYAAITRAKYGKGTNIYVGCSPRKSVIKNVYRTILDGDKEKMTQPHYPIIIRRGMNREGHQLVFVFNYSGQEQSFQWIYGEGIDLLTNRKIYKGHEIDLSPWGFNVYFLVRNSNNI